MHQESYVHGPPDLLWDGLGAADDTEAEFHALHDAEGS